MQVVSVTAVQRSSRTPRRQEDPQAKSNITTALADAKVYTYADGYA